MKVYASRAVLSVAGFMAFVSISLVAVFFIFFETISSRDQTIDWSVASVLIVIAASQLVALINFWRFPTMMIDSESVFFQRFPYGQRKVPRSDLDSVERKYLGISQVLEVKYKLNGKLKHSIITAPVADQEKIIRELGLAKQ